MTILLLTGAPGVGKTTVLRKVAAGLPEFRLGGFYTEEMREEGEREGFRIVSFDSRQAIMADRHFPGPRVGKYGVDVGTIDAMVQQTLAADRAADIYLVDEIGRMECLSARFVVAMGALLDSGRPVAATVSLHGTGFIEEVKHLPGITLWQVTCGNRDDLARDVIAWLKQHV